MSLQVCRLNLHRFSLIMKLQSSYAWPYKLYCQSFGNKFPKIELLPKNCQGRDLFSKNCFRTLIIDCRPEAQQHKTEGMSLNDSDVFEGEPDRFKGVTIYSAQEYDNCKNFAAKLKKSLDNWKQNGKRCVWFYLEAKHHDWISVLLQEKFDFHHAKKGKVTLYKWISDEPDKIPSYAHTMVGAGGIVINDKNELLVVSETYATIQGSFKIPGGYTEPGEDLAAGAIREIKEETNIDCVYESLVTIRHMEQSNFLTGDLYFVFALKPCSFDLKADKDEISKAMWMPIQEYLNHPKVHTINKDMIKTYLDLRKEKVRLNKTDNTHPISKKTVHLYMFEKEKD